MIADAIQKGLDNWSKIRQKNENSIQILQNNKFNSKKSILSNETKKILRRAGSKRRFAGAQTSTNSGSIKISRKRKRGDSKKQARAMLPPVDKIEEVSNEGPSQLEESQNEDRNNLANKSIKRKNLGEIQPNPKQLRAIRGSNQRNKNRKTSMRRMNSQNKKKFGSVKRIKPNSQKNIGSRNSELGKFRRITDKLGILKMEQERCLIAKGQEAPTQVVFAGYMRGLRRKKSQIINQKNGQASHKTANQGNIAQQLIGPDPRLLLNNLGKHKKQRKGSRILRNSKPNSIKRKRLSQRAEQKIIGKQRCLLKNKETWLSEKMIQKGNGSFKENLKKREIKFTKDKGVELDKNFDLKEKNKISFTNSKIKNLLGTQIKN